MTLQQGKHHGNWTPHEPCWHDDPGLDIGGFPWSSMPLPPVSSHGKPAGEGLGGYHKYGSGSFPAPKGSSPPALGHGGLEGEGLDGGEGIPWDEDGFPSPWGEEEPPDPWGMGDFPSPWDWDPLGEDSDEDGSFEGQRDS